jgi:hypothetical protein
MLSNAFHDILLDHISPVLSGIAKYPAPKIDRLNFYSGEKYYLRQTSVRALPFE